MNHKITMVISAQTLPSRRIWLRVNDCSSEFGFSGDSTLFLVEQS